MGINVEERLAEQIMEAEKQVASAKEALLGDKVSHDQLAEWKKAYMRRNRTLKILLYIRDGGEITFE